MWKLDTPVEPGWYWLWGYPWSNKIPENTQPRMYSVNVRQVRNGVVYVCDGQFIWPTAKPLAVMWHPAEVPTPPKWKD